MGCAPSKSAVVPDADSAEPGGGGGGDDAPGTDAAGRSLAAKQLRAQGQTAAAPSPDARRLKASSALVRAAGGLGGLPPPGSAVDAAAAAAAPNYQFKAFAARFTALEDVTRALRKAGLESSNLVVAVDYTKSNVWQTRHGPAGLHTLRPDWGPGRENPYQRAIRTIGATLAGFDDDGLIPVFGFGDTTTTDRAVFPFFSDRPARGFQEVLARYAELTPKVVMSGPTSFAPAIDAAVHIVKTTGQYHILLVLADGQVTSAKATADAVVRASGVALTILIVGVGDEIDEEAMRAMDEGLPARRFDNLHFVRLSDDMTDVEFAVEALMEVPDQYRAIRQLGFV